MKHIINVEEGFYDINAGYDDDGEAYQFVTNILEREREQLTELCSNYPGKAKFATFDTAYGFDEEGISFPVHSCFGFYVQHNDDPLTAFWRAWSNLKNQH